MKTLKITHHVPLDEIDFSGSTVTPCVDQHEAWGRVFREETYDIEIYAEYQGEEVEVVDYESAQEIVLEMHIKKAFEDE